MAMANMDLIGVFVTKLCPVQALACGVDVRRWRAALAAVSSETAAEPKT